MMNKVVNWREQLSTVVEEKRLTQAEPGVHDCALFAADCIRAMTGEDLAEPYRGKYHTLEEGLALLQADGYTDLCEFIAAHLAEIHPVFARAGDIMAVPSDQTGWAIGVVNGERVTVLRPDGSLGTINRTLATRAFKCP